ncbi:RES family NAD+ phosphorylase [Geomonas sp. Red32]|nr:RES family NAD+ phosphorylase [Geomonas sp. Red32]
MDVTGEGARIAGGRWNPSGRPALYTAEHPSLAMLEILAHLDRSCAPPDLQLATITLPGSCTIYSPSLDDLPSDWQARPAPMTTVRFGKKWLDDGVASILKVPSVMTPNGMGWNFILNPLHPELAGKVTVSLLDWPLDSRVLP